MDNLGDQISNNVMGWALRSRSGRAGAAPSAVAEPGPSFSPPDPMPQPSFQQIDGPVPQQIGSGLIYPEDSGSSDNAREALKQRRQKQEKETYKAVDPNEF